MIDIEEATGLMDEDLQNIEVSPHNFEAATPAQDCLQTGSPVSLQQSDDYSQRSRGHSWARRRLMHAASMLNLFSLPGLPWGSSGDKIELTTAEVESLRSEIADAEERESHLKAQLEHVDEILRSARLAGYLFIRNRWTALPGEPPIDDTDVDDWLPRFVVLNGPCIFFYLQSTDLSPQDSTLLSDVVEVETMPSFLQEDQQMRHSFYILTHQGLRFECSSLSKVQVDSWLAALRMDCNLGSSAVTEDPIKS